MTVELKPETEQLVQEEINSGHFHTVDELIKEGVYAWREKHQVMESTPSSGAREQEWVRSHWQEYAGRWVALDGSRLVADAAGAREALEKARAAGVVSPFLVHVAEPSELPFGGW